MEKLGNKLTVRSYFNADTPEEATRLLEEAVKDGAQVVFTTAPLLRAPTLKAAIEYPKVQFLNCSVTSPIPVSGPTMAGSTRANLYRRLAAHWPRITASATLLPIPSMGSCQYQRLLPWGHS